MLRLGRSRSGMPDRGSWSCRSPTPTLLGGSLISMSGNDHAILELAAANVVVVPEHVLQLLTVDAAEAERLLDGLVDGGLLVRHRVSQGGPACYCVTQAGLDAVASGLPAPTFELARVRREIGVTWVWMGARGGAFGPVERVMSCRELVAAGELADADVVLVRSDGWLPLHLVLSLPERSWLERVLRRYGSDPRFAGWMFLAEDLEPAREFIGGVAEELGLSELTRVQGARFT